MKRLTEADILRTTAIMLILSTHMLSYFLIPSLQPYRNYAVIFGLGLFIFLSGYLIHASTRRHPDSTLVSFMGHRLLRLMPLYWLALAVFAAILARPNLPTLLLHVLGLQVVLAPALVTPLVTLWFIGMILAYYLVYYLVIRQASRPRSMALAAALAFIPLVAVRSTMGILEVRFFLYYFVFMAGVVVCESGVMERAQPRTVILLLVSSISFLTLFVLEGSPLVEETPGLALDPHLITTIVIANGMIISWALLGWLIAKNIAPHLRPWAVGMFTACSVASYFVYLFHRPILAVVNYSLDRLSLAEPIQYIVALLIAVPILFLIGYKVQKLVDGQTRRLLEHFQRSEVSFKIPSYKRTDQR